MGLLNLFKREVLSLPRLSAYIFVHSTVQFRNSPRDIVLSSSSIKGASAWIDGKPSQQAAGFVLYVVVKRCPPRLATVLSGHLNTAQLLGRLIWRYPHFR